MLVSKVLSLIISSFQNFFIQSSPKKCPEVVLALIIDLIRILTVELELACNRGS